MGLKEAFHTGEFQGAEKHELERVHVQLPSSSHVFPHPPVLPDHLILALPPLPFAILGVAAGGEPGWPWTTVRRPHHGLPGSPLPGLHAPITNAPSTGSGVECQWAGKNGWDGVSTWGERRGVSPWEGKARGL